MRHASVADPSPSWALLSVISSSTSSVGIVRPALCLHRSSQQPHCLAGRSTCIDGGCCRGWWLATSTGPSYAPADAPTAVVFAAASLSATIGMICAILAMENASSAVDIDLWRCSQKRHQQACERRSADTKRSINEGFAGVRKVWDPFRLTTEGNGTAAHRCR